MSFSSELAALYRRDLVKLAMQVRAFPSAESLWAVSGPGVTNPAGNLALHLEGNLREYIGRQLGGVEYTRVREREFADKGPRHFPPSISTEPIRKTFSVCRCRHGSSSSICKDI